METFSLNEYHDMIFWMWVIKYNMQCSDLSWINIERNRNWNKHPPNSHNEVQTPHTRCSSISEEKRVVLVSPSKRIMTFSRTDYVFFVVVVVVVVVVFLQTIHTFWKLADTTPITTIELHIIDKNQIITCNHSGIFSHPRSTSKIESQK